MRYLPVATAPVARAPAPRRPRRRLRFLELEAKTKLVLAIEVAQVVPPHYLVMGEKLFWVGMNSIFLIMTHILFIFLVFAYYMIHISLMKTTSPLPGPVKVALKKLGADISDARKRRRVPTTLMAERAFISRSTLGRIEKGDPSVSLGNYAAVLFVLGLTDRLKNLVDANNDPVGRALEEERLPKRIHLPKTHE